MSYELLATICIAIIAGFYLIQQKYSDIICCWVDKFYLFCYLIIVFITSWNLSYYYNEGKNFLFYWRYVVALIVIVVVFKFIEKLYYKDKNKPEW